MAGFIKFSVAPLLAMQLSCATRDPLAIPLPARSVTRSEVIATAHVYTQLQWMPEERHVKHGEDANGITVNTPDVSLNRRGFANGWWKPGEPAIGMPYQWGGFDTPKGFIRSLEKGEFAGDISTRSKRALGDQATSSAACGIDCSGFVSRCWRLERPYSTRELPQISLPLKSWFQLQAGDILLNDKHVLIFKDWAPDGKSVFIYEAGPYPFWRVNSARISVSKLKREGYAPRFYVHIRD